MKPAACPRARLGEVIHTALADPELRARFAEIGFDLVNSSASALQTFLGGELARRREGVTTGPITVE